MKKSIKALIAITAVSMIGAGTLTACPKHHEDNPPIEEREYSIIVSAPSAVTYTLSKEKAKKGEEVSLTITGVSNGVSVKKVTMNDATLTGEGNVYKFTMPDRSASITISLAVEGDVVIEGDIAAKLEEIGSTGVYVARNVKATGTKSSSAINWSIKSGDKMTKCAALDLDETKSFATIELNGGKEYAFNIANGFTYDFYYDENSAETPCYVQRVKCDDLPTTVDMLADLMITSPSIRAEYAVFPDDYVGAYYKIVDHSTDDVVEQTYNWKLYENNLSFATVENNDALAEDEELYVYKKFDAETGIYQTVDTYPLKKGNMQINDDRYRIDVNNHTEGAGTFYTVKGDDRDYRYAVEDRYAVRNVRSSAHMPNYFVERDFYRAYRAGFGADNGMSAYDISIVPTANTDGSFTIALNSFGEYDTSSSGGASLEAIRKAYVYKVDLSFNAKSELTSLNYKETHYSDEQWDFTEHAPKPTVKGTIVKKVEASYTYGAPFSGTPNYGDFKKEDYFVSSLEGLQFYNTKVNDVASRDEGKSTVAIGDTLYIKEPDGEINPEVVNKKFFAPATALDLWQYGPTASSDESVIGKLANNSSYQMSVINEGNANVTFSSHVEGYGPSITVPIKVVATSGVRDFFMDATRSKDGDTLTTSERADIKAGGTYEYYVDRYPSDSALKYHAVSENTKLLKVTSADNARNLVIDVNTTEALKLTKNTVVKVTMEADYGGYEYGGKWVEYGPTVFEFTILPADIDPAGSWKINSPDCPNTVMTFTKEKYEGTTVKGMENALKGTIHDDYYSGGKLVSSDDYKFYYTFKNGKLEGVVYDVQMTNPDGVSTNAKDWVIWFYYKSDTNQYALFLAASEYDADYEMEWYYPAIGDWSYQNPDVFVYTLFDKVA